MAQPASKDMALDDPATAEDIIVVLCRTKQETASAALDSTTVPGWQDTEEGRNLEKEKCVLLPGTLDVSNGTADNKSEQEEIKLRLHTSRLRDGSAYFEAKLSRWNMEAGSFGELKSSDCELPELIVECEDLSACSLALRLLYASEGAGKRNETLPFKDTKQAVEVLQAASFLGCETSIQACCDYLNAVVWSEEEADIIKEVEKELGSEVFKALADKLEKFEADAEFLEPLFETLLSGMLDGNEMAEELITVHANLKWQGLSQDFVKNALSKKIVELSGEFKRLLHGDSSYGREFYLRKLSPVSQLLRFCLIHGVCHSEAVEAIAKPELTPKFSEIIGRYCSDKASAEKIFGFISNVLTLIQCTSLEEEKKVQMAQAWILAGACLGNFAGFRGDLASCPKNLLEVAKDLFFSFNEADQDVCRHEWAALRETDASSGNLMQSFAWMEATNFGATSDPMVLMRMHLKGGFENRKLTEAVSKFIRSCPELVPELIGSWNQLQEQPNLSSSASNAALWKIFEAAAGCGYPVSVVLMSQLLVKWMGAICNLTRTSPEGLMEVTKLEGLTETLFLSLPPKEQGKVAKVWAGTLTKAGQYRNSRSSPVDVMFTSWFKTSVYV